MNMIKENGFINDKYILTALEAECCGEIVTFFIRARKFRTYADAILLDYILAIEDDGCELSTLELCHSTCMLV